MAKKEETQEMELEQDPVINEEDDFEFGKKPAEGGDDKKGEEKETSGKDTKSEDEKTEEEEEKSDEDDKGSDDKDKEEDKTDDEVEDIFADDKQVEDEKPSEFDFNAMATDLGLEVEEGKKIESKDDFLKTVKGYIDKNKQEPDLSKFSPEARKVIEHLNKGDASLETFFENPVITSMNQMLAMGPEEKVRNLRYQELLQEHGNDAEKATEALTEEFEEYSKGQIKTMAEDIDKQAREIRENEIKKIIGEAEKQSAKKIADTTEAQKKQRDNLINYVSKQDSFFGIPLTKAGKEIILKDIDTGKFDQVIEQSPEETKFFSYMAAKYGSKIVERYNSVMKDEKRKAYNEAQDKEARARHKLPGDSKQSAGAGKTESQKSTKEGFDRWKEKGVFGDDE